MLVSLRPSCSCGYRSRAAARGVTRFELMLGLGAAAVAALVATVVQVAEKGADPDQEAEKRGKVVLSAASDWKREHAHNGCPSITQLQRDDALEPSARAEDPWGKRFRILCTSGEIQVRSAGGDGRFETPDDITLAAAPNT